MAAEYLCKIAGVMSTNPDGENRQDIIRNIIEESGNTCFWSGPGRIQVSTRPGTGETLIGTVVSYLQDHAQDLIGKNAKEIFAIIQDILEKNLAK